LTARLHATLLGTGSSGGVPRIGNEWGVCDPNEPRNRRRRCSLLVEQISDEAYRPTRVLIDTSPDLREQLLDAGVDALDGIVFTHDHADQTHGIDDVRVVAYRMRQRIPAWLDADTARTLLKKFSYCFEGQGSYPAILERQPLIEIGVPLQVDGPSGSIEMLPLLQEHGAIPSLGFRLDWLAYCNDISDLPDESLTALKGVDTLIIDALRYTPHPTHAHLDKALGWAREIGARRTVLTNMHVDLDYATVAAETPDHIVPAHDGLVLTVPD